MQGRAAMLWSETDTEWSVEDIEIDEPQGRELLVRNVASGLCHSDEHFITGDMPHGGYPWIAGHEGAGIVEAVGPEVRDFQPGDHIVYSFVAACGQCPSCAEGHSNLCDNGALVMSGRMLDGTSRIRVKGQDALIMAGLGTFATHSVVHEWSAVKVLDDLPLDKLVLLGCGATTGWGSAVYAAEVKPGDNVAVVGVGGLGSAAVQGARLAGAERIFAIDPVELKREQAQGFGATHTAASVEEATELIREETWGRMCNKVICTMGVGDGALMAQIMGITSKRGRVVVTNIHPWNEASNTIPLIDLTLTEKQVVGSLFGSANPRSDIPRLAELYRKGQLDLDGMITRTYTLDQINEGYQDMRDGKNIRGVVLHQ
jgi:S-(hydroxymethyl)glutathione dehydrogenase/alcohol dehydrogenase